MPKRCHADFCGYVPGRSVAARGEDVRTLTNEARAVTRGYGYRKPRSVPSRYQGTLRRSGFYGRYTRRTQYARLRRGLHIEKKFFDTAMSFSFDATGEVPATGQLSLIPQGVTESTRVGRQCQIKSLQLRGTVLYTPAADTSGASIAYILLVQDRQANGAAAAVTDVMTSSNLAVGMVNLANSERFRIIKRWNIDLTSGAGVSGAYARDLKTVDFYTKLNVPLEFSSTTGAITELKSNNLFILAGADITDDEITFSGSCRLRFTDI